MARGPEKDPYTTLGVSPQASADEIKKAYRKLAQKHHPDRGGDEDKFKEVSVAYDVLGNADKRAQFDAYQSGGAQMPSDFGGFDFGDLFSQMFGGAGAGHGPGGGRVEYRVNVGGSPFGGFSGGDPFGGGADPFTNVRARPRTRQATKKKPAADRKVRAADGTILMQRGSDVYSDARIGFDQAVLGTVASISTLGGSAKVKIPPGTSSGVKLRLKGKGAPKSDGTRGNHYVTVQIDVPSAVDSEAETLLAKFMKRVKKKSR